jgi:hypothetical protein
MKTEQSLKVRLRLQIVITLPPPHAFAHRFVSSISGDTVMPDHWLGLWMNKTCATSLQIRHEKSHAVKHHWWVNPRKHDNYFRQHDGPSGAYFKGRFASGSVYFCGALMLHELKKKRTPLRHPRIQPQPGLADEKTDPIEVIVVAVRMGFGQPRRTWRTPCH